MAEIYERIAQAMLDYLPRLNPATSGGRLRLGAWRSLRRQLLTRADPLVTYGFEHHRLRLPFSHDLPLIRHLQPQYMTNVTRLARQVAAKYPGAVGVDIGANIGDTVLAIRQAAPLPLLCVEGHAPFFCLLEANVGTFPDIELDHSFVGYGPETVAGDLQAQGGTAYWVPGPDTGQTLSVKPFAEVLRAHPRFAEANFLKLDTDGLDCAILGSALDWLVRAKPVIFFEYDPAAYARYSLAGFDVFDQLQHAGYTAALFWDNRGDYLLACDLNDTRLLEDLHHFYVGRRGEAYCDIAVFHAHDVDLMRSMRAVELTFFKQFRSAVGQTWTLSSMG